MKKADNFDASKWLVENKITTQSRLNENQIPGVDVEVDDDMITLSGDSGDYDGFIEDDGTVSFTVTNDEEEFNDQNWKDILGDDHAFVKIANAINTDVEAIDDYVMITVKADDLTNTTQSKLNESILKIYRYDPSSYKLKDVKVKNYPSQEEAKQAAVAHNWQVAWDNGDTDLSKEEYINKYSWEDLDSLAYNTYGYEIK